MFSAAFIFEPGTCDDRFHALDAQIESAARANPGFLGSENWKSSDGRRVNATYYWTDLASLKAFSNDPSHLEAKRHYQQWYKGFQIVISEVVRSYGDGAFEHITPNFRNQKHISEREST
jgi:heme-degrading monooxygenase HmoA